jgi:hypothetical protein
MMANNGTGGSRLPNFGFGDSCAWPFAPPPRLQRLHWPPLPLIWSLDLSLWMRLLYSPPLFRYFMTNRAGASSTGDGSILYDAGKPVTSRSTTAVRRGSAVKTQSLAASPRPRNRGPLLAGQPASLLLAWTCRVGVLLNTDGGGGSLPYHSSAMDAVCRRRPPRPRFLATPGPLSS